MGAFTLKSFLFELRGWISKNLKGIDPTDEFGSSIRIYISKDLIVLIKPDYDYKSQTFNTWYCKTMTRHLVDLLCLIILIYMVDNPLDSPFLVEFIYFCVYIIIRMPMMLYYHDI